MKCPHCGYAESKVTDSRPQDDNSTIRRRRECLSCQKRFTTYEILENLQPIVLKKDGSQEYFDRNKLMAGLLKACQKRPVDVQEIVKRIENEIQNSLTNEIPSSKIGDMAMELLREQDAVAYVRYASVHREFKDVETFMEELRKLRDN
ncbi:MAG: transcriptional repressor NrdR [Clostridia bacterium]|nr:transcriptional repressor NrdR [Clostridia bacterium]